jgi:hypothetical protein
MRRVATLKLRVALVAVVAVERRGSCLAAMVLRAEDMVAVLLVDFVGWVQFWIERGCICGVGWRLGTFVSWGLMGERVYGFGLLEAMSPELG